MAGIMLPPVSALYLLLRQPGFIEIAYKEDGEVSYQFYYKSK